MPSAFIQDPKEEKSEMEQPHTFYFTLVLERGIKYGRLLFEMFGIYFVWIFLHYICAHLYVQLCTPLNFIGFLISPFAVPSLQCQALRWVISTGGNSITAMWFALGAWIGKKLVL